MIKLNLKISGEKIEGSGYSWKKPTAKEIEFVKSCIKEFLKDLELEGKNEKNN